MGMEFVSADLRASLSALGGISGRSTDEDLLDRIFSRFCLGK
jgi:tRNA modification GTPase